MSDQRPPYAWRPVGAVALGLFTLLLALASRYGYHRDELYFLAAGRHLDWAYGSGAGDAARCAADERGLGRIVDGASDYIGVGGRGGRSSDGIAGAGIRCLT